MRTNTQITLLTRGITPRIDRPQYEDGTELGLMVMDTDISGYSAQIYEKKSDGTVVYNSCTIEDNTIVVTLDNQMTASEGENRFTIRLTKSGHETFAFPLILNIIGVPFGGEESHSESSILQAFIDEAEGYADDAHDSAVDALASKNAAKAYYDNLASFGTKNHSIMDSNGSPMPARDTLQFANSRVTDDATNDKTIVAPAHGHTNLLNPTLGTTTSNGVTCTANGDGTYTLNGTATKNVFFGIVARNDISEYNYKHGITYKLVGCPSNGGVNRFRLDLYKYNSANELIGNALDDGTGKTFSFDDEEVRTEIGIRGYEGQTYTNLTFKPMLTTDLSATYDDYVQYSGNGELNQNVAALYEGLESTDANLADIQSQIVTSDNIESSNTATSAHTVGTYIQWKGKFYTVTAAIAVGDTLADGTNLAAKTVGDVLTQINSNLSDICTDGTILSDIWSMHNISQNYSTTVDFNMPVDGYVVTRAGAGNNNTMQLLSLYIFVGNNLLKTNGAILSDDPYAELSFTTPRLKKGTKVQVYVNMIAQSWEKDARGLFMVNVI